MRFSFYIIPSAYSYAFRLTGSSSILPIFKPTQGNFRAERKRSRAQPSQKFFSSSYGFVTMFICREISRILCKLHLIGIKIVKVLAAVHLLCSRIPHGKREDEKTLKQSRSKQRNNKITLWILSLFQGDKSKMKIYFLNLTSDFLSMRTVNFIDEA